MLSELGEQLDPKKKWEKLQSVGMVESVRMVNGKTTVKTRYYISSLPNNAQTLGESVRSHYSQTRISQSFKSRKNLKDWGEK